MSEECRCEEYRKEILWLQDALLEEMANCNMLIVKIDSMVMNKYPELKLTEEEKKKYPHTTKARKKFVESYGE